MPVRRSSTKKHKQYAKEALTANIGQLSSQMLVFLLHCKVVLAYAREALDNRLHQKCQKNQHANSWLEGKPKCKHFDSPSGATEG
jgi:hypothetical protein